MNIQGNLFFNGKKYEYEYNQTEGHLLLQTLDSEYNIGVEFVCKETAETEKRWRAFQRIFARSVAKRYFNVQ